ncbi:MAG: SMP-30/gluconolactonase/LRE family protein [Nannocystaceae bacterium]
MAASANWLTKMKDFDPTLGELPESITTDQHGNLYLTMRNTVQKLTPSGVRSTYATLPVPPGVLAAGLKFNEDGELFVATGSLSPVPPAAYVWRVAGDGEVSVHAALDPEGFPNDLAFDDEDNLYVTDPLLGQIWKLDPDGEPSVWIDHPALDGDEDEPFLGLSHFGVDGIAFDKHHKRLYVGNLDYGTILRIKVQEDGSAGPLEFWVDDFEHLAGADGIAFDAFGNLFVAVNGQDRLVAIDPWRNVYVLAEGGLLDAPSGLCFGVTPWTRHNLYVTNFAITRAYGIKDGVPQPSLAKVTTLFPGLPL